jgi:phosphoglycolate phosphatase
MIHALKALACQNFFRQNGTAIMDIKAILFDKDGTLFDFSATFDAATALVLDEICQGNKELVSKAAEAINYDLKTAKILPDSIVVAGTGADIAQALSPVLQIGDVERFGQGIDELYGEICINTVKTIDGVGKTLDGLHEEGILLGLVTNDTEENAISQMEQVELDHLFENIMGADSGYGQKPGSGMIDAFVGFHGLQPYQVMMVGDSVHDMDAGVAAGVVTVAVETGPATREELEPHADFVIASVNALPDLIAGRA